MMQREQLVTISNSTTVVFLFFLKSKKYARNNEAAVVIKQISQSATLKTILKKNFIYIEKTIGSILTEFDLYHMNKTIRIFFKQYSEKIRTSGKLLDHFWMSHSSSKCFLKYFRKTDLSSFCSFCSRKATEGTKAVIKFWVQQGISIASYLCDKRIY